MYKSSLLLCLSATCLLTFSACNNQPEKQEEATSQTATQSTAPSEPVSSQSEPEQKQATQPAGSKTVQTGQPAGKDSGKQAVGPNQDPNFIKGMQALQAGRPADAIAALSLYLNSHPKDIQVLNNRGVAYLRSGKYDLALKDYNTAISLNPNLASSYYNRASLRILQKQDPLQDLSKTISVDPTFLPALYDRANLYYMQKRYDKAIQDLNQILKYAPNNPDTYNFRGYLYLQQDGKLAEAMKDFDQTLKLNPKFAVAMANKAQTLYKMGKCAESIEWLKKSCQAGHQKGCQLLQQIKCK